MDSDSVERLERLVDELCSHLTSVTRANECLDRIGRLFKDVRNRCTTPKMRNVQTQTSPVHQSDERREPSSPFSILFRDAVTYEMQPGQTLEAYSVRKIEKLSNIQIPDVYIIDMVIGGIPDYNIAQTVRSARITDVNDLFAFMKNLDRMPPTDEWFVGRM